MDIKAKKKMMMTTALLFVICLMTIVCSSYDQEMIVNGQAYLRVDEEIRVVDLKMLSVKMEDLKLIIVSLLRHLIICM